MSGEEEHEIVNTEERHAEGGLALLEERRRPHADGRHPGIMVVGRVRGLPSLKSPLADVSSHTHSQTSVVLCQ